MPVPLTHGWYIIVRYNVLPKEAKEILSNSSDGRLVMIALYPLSYRVTWLTIVAQWVVLYGKQNTGYRVRRLIFADFVTGISGALPSPRT